MALGQEQQVVYFNQDGTLQNPDGTAANTANQDSGTSSGKDYFYMGSPSGVEQGYTDEEKKIVDHYYHTGKAQRIIKEECEKDPELCSTSDVKRNMLAETAAKMYGMVIQGMGGKIDYGTKTPDSKGGAGKSSEATSSKDGAKGKGEKNEGTDYCAYGAMAVETVAMSTQKQKDDNLMNLPMSEENKQKELLEKIKRTHEERAETTKIQEIGWGATSACYVALMGYGAMTGSAGTTAKSVGLRLGASVFLYDYFKKIRKAQEARARKVQELIDKLPHTGDCNPVSERNCFCNEETSKADPLYAKYCLPEAFQEYLNQNATRISCLDDKMKEDPECNCLATDTCYDKEFSSMIHKIPTATAVAPQATEAYKNISQGRLEEGDLSGVGQLQQGAVKRELNKINKLLKAPTNSDNEQMSEILSTTLPANLAKSLANAKLSSRGKSAAKKFRSHVASLNPNSYTGQGRNRIKVLRFSGGNGLNKSRRKTKRQKSSAFNRFKKKRKKSGVKVLRFSERATKRAQIIRRKDTPIFDIISRRYKLSGWPIFLD